MNYYLPSLAALPQNIENIYFPSIRLNICTVILFIIKRSLNFKYFSVNFGKKKSIQITKIND